MQEPKSKLVQAVALLLLGAINSTCIAEGYIEPPMKNIPAGSFFMGNDETLTTQPVKKVALSEFQLGKYSVTVAEFKKFAEATGFSRPSTCNDHIDENALRGPTHIGKGHWKQHKHSYSDFQPVTCISWQDAKAYAKWLSIQTGKHYRLPTEEEYEYAAKGNSTSRFYWGHDADLSQACHYGNFADDTGEHTNNQLYGLTNVGWIGKVNCDDGEAYVAMVGLYRPNPFGLFDMAGNTSDYVDGCYSSKGYTEQRVPAQQCEFISHRGGTWHYPSTPHYIRGRFKREGWNVGANTGFRLALDAHHTSPSPSSVAFEQELKHAQERYLTARARLIKTPQQVKLVQIKPELLVLSWQPSNDNRVTSYDVLRSISPLSHHSGGFYKKHYRIYKSVDKSRSFIEIDAPSETTSFIVLAKSESDESLPSKVVTSQAVTKANPIPGRITADSFETLENVKLFYSEKQQVHYLNKTQIEQNNDLVRMEIAAEVASSGWYRVDFLGSSLFTQPNFLEMWLGNRHLGTLAYDKSDAEKNVAAQMVFLPQGQHIIELTTLRNGFDRWTLDWIEFVPAD